MSYSNHNAVRGNNFATHTITAADATAGSVTLNSRDDLGISGFLADLGITGYIVQLYDQNTNVGRLLTDYDVTVSDEEITIADGATYTLTEGDVINLIVY